MRVGGPAARLVTATTTDELVDAVREVDDADERCSSSAAGQPRPARRGLPRHRRPRRDGRGRRRVRRLVRRRQRPGRGGGAVGRPRRPRGRRGLGGHRGAVRDPGLDRGHAGAERRRLRPGGRDHRRPGASGTGASSGCGPSWPECGFAYRDSRASSPATAPAAGTSSSTSSSSADRDLGEPVRYADLARQLDVARVRGRRSPTSARAVLAQRRPPRHGARRGRPRTRGPAARSSPNRSSARGRGAPSSAGDERLGADVDPPSWAEPGGADEDQRGVAHRARRLRQGARVPGAASLSTKHTLAVTNRGGATAADVLALAREVRDGVRDTFGVTLVNEPVLVGTTL